MSSEVRRRLDSILSPAFLDDLDSASPSDLRAKLREARIEEDALSYVRRNLHGRLDLLRAELARRRGEGDAGRSVQGLASVLADQGFATGVGRAGLSLRSAAIAATGVEEIVSSDDALARLPDLGDADIEGIIDQAATAERNVSQQRRQIHAVIDAIEAEMATRYKAGLEPSLERLG
jgi:hypothetical protein